MGEIKLLGQNLVQRAEPPAGAGPIRRETT